MKLLWLVALAVAVLPQQEAPTREKVRERLLLMCVPGCGFDHADHARELARLGQAALDALPELIKEQEGRTRQSLVQWYGYLAEMKEPRQTPAVVINHARNGDWFAAQIALKIRDDRAIAFLIDGLKRIAADDCTERGTFEVALIEGAGWTHSDEVGKALLAMLGDLSATRKIQVIDALGNLGYAPALEPLKRLAAEKYPIPGRSRDAITKILAVTSPDRAAKLAAMVRGKMMSGEFSWYRWALDHILHQKLTDAVPELRTDYDEFVKKFGLPQDGTQWAALLLHAIHKLGGTLSPEEMKLLTDLGRLPPAKAVTDTEEVKKGFAEGVWAPRVQRQRERDVRNVPAPRIPADMLPKEMRDRIRHVLGLKPPDPSYLAPEAKQALITLEEMLTSPVEAAERDRLLEAYLYLARLREGMRTPDFVFDLVRNTGNRLAALIVLTIADERAEEWYLGGMPGMDTRGYMFGPGRLATPDVHALLVKKFRENERERVMLLEALVDRGCVEILPDLRKMDTRRYEIKFAIERLEIFTSPDRDAKLLAFATNLARSGEFSWADWGLGQVVRLQLKNLAPDLRKWYDAAKVKWTPSHDPNRLIYKMPWVLHKLGASLTPEEEILMRLGGRGP